MKSIELPWPGLKLKALTCALLLLLITATAARCQTWGEWWSQKSTQKKYLLQQIAALQVYTGFLQKGYNIARSGLNTVKDITGGEFSLHDGFISSLKQVSPAIRRDTRIIEIIEMQISVLKTFNAIANSGYLSADQLGYVSDVREKVNSECATDLEELLLVITSGKLEMSDDERIKRLNRIYLSMQDKSAFTQDFCNDVGLLIRQKAGEQESINRLRRYYEIP